MFTFDPETLGKISALPDEQLLKQVLEVPGLLHEEKLQKRFEEISEQWEKEIQKLPRHVSYKKTLYLFHLCPWLIKSTVFSWLADKLCEMAVRRHFDSRVNKDYWDAVYSLKGEFQKTKSHRPELPFMIYLEVHDNINLNVHREEIKLLTNLYKTFLQSNMTISLTKKIKITTDIVDDELLRFSELVGKYKDSKEYKTEPKTTIEKIIEKHSKELLSLLLQDENSNKEFWGRVYKQILNKENEFKRLAISEVSKKRKISERRVKRHLQSVSNSIFAPFIEVICSKCKRFKSIKDVGIITDESKHAIGYICKDCRQK